MIMHSRFLVQIFQFWSVIFFPVRFRSNFRSKILEIAQITEFWSEIWVSKGIQLDLIKNRHFNKTRIFARIFRAEKQTENSGIFRKFNVIFKILTYFSKSSYFRISDIFSLYRVFQIFLLKTYFTDFQKPK